MQRLMASPVNGYRRLVSVKQRWLPQVAEQAGNYRPGCFRSKAMTSRVGVERAPVAVHETRVVALADGAALLGEVAGDRVRALVGERVQHQAHVLVAVHAVLLQGGVEVIGHAHHEGVVVSAVALDEPLDLGDQGGRDQGPFLLVAHALSLPSTTLSGKPLLFAL